MKYKKILISMLLCLVLVLGIAYLHKYRTNLKILFNSYNITNLEPSKIVDLDILNIGNITCTGLAYDSKNKSFWIADYGAKTSVEKKNSPRIIEVDETISKVKRIIEIKDIIGNINLQGISYSHNTNSLWLATGDYILNINLDGKIKSKIKIEEKLKDKTNGIFYNDEKNELNVLCYNKWLLTYNHKNILTNKKKINFKNQDQITYISNKLYISVGADYNHNNNYIFMIDNYNLKKIYKMLESFAIEGIAYKNGQMYVANDGIYHSSKIRKNYIAIYNFDTE